MKYSKEIAFKRKQDLLQIEASIKQAEETLISDPSASNLEALEKLKNKYDSHFDYIAEGAIVRSRATWYEQGEKSNKYFLGLESNRGKKSCIRRMFTSKGTLILNQKKIMAEIENFYSDLYASNDEEEVADPTFFQTPGIPKLTLDMKSACEGKLRVKECFDCLQSFENCKSPGEDGGRLLLSCNFNVKNLPVTLPKFYAECLQTFSEHSVSVREQVLNLSNSSRSSTVIWNNRHILIDGKSVFYQSLFDKGIVTLENLVTDTNVLLVRQDPNELPFTLLEWFHLIQIFEALPTQWRKSLTSCDPKVVKLFCGIIKLNSILKTRPYRSRASFPRMFILKSEQDMKLDQLRKRDLKNSFLIYALIGTTFINCLLMFS